MSELAHEHAPRGSSLYYSLLSVAPLAREAIIALQAYANELRKISERYSEPSIAKVKLQWWQEEIERLFRLEPRHPITKALQPFILQFQWPKASFLALIEASLLSLETEVFESQADLNQHYQHTGGIIESLKAQVLLNGNKSEKVEQFAHLMGTCNEMVRHIDDFAQFYHKGHYYLPLKELEAKQLNPEQLQENDLAPLLKNQTNLIRQYYKDGIAVMPATYQQALRPLRIYTNLNLLLLSKIERDGFKVLSYRISLSPILKLWHSWRVK